MRISLPIAAMLLASAYLASSQSKPQTTQDPFPGLPPDVQKKIEGLAKVQKAFEAHNMNSAGFDVVLKEQRRAKTVDRTLVTYSIHATGFSNEKLYDLVQVNIDGTIAPAMRGISFDGSGEAVCAGNRPGACEGEKVNDPIDLVMFAAKGEPKRFGLIPQDGQAKAFAEVIPFPISSVDHGCELQLIMGKTDEEVAYVIGKGFPSNTDALLYSKSYEEIHTNTVKIEKDGSYFTIVLPYVAGKTSGKSIVQLKSQACSPQIEFQWGKGTYHLE